MRGVKKENLPEKICVVCQRPFTWRKKWEKNWHEVKYCSDACRSQGSGVKDRGSGFRRANQKERR